MFKQLLRSLFSTFVISLVVAIAAVSIFYAVSQKNGNYAHAVPLIISGTFFLNFIILIMTSPVLFLSSPELWSNRPFRILLYFSGPLAFAVATFFVKVHQHDQIVYFITAVIFLITHSIFYFKLAKKNA